MDVEGHNNVGCNVRRGAVYISLIEFREFASGMAWLDSDPSRAILVSYGGEEHIISVMLEQAAQVFSDDHPEAAVKYTYNIAPARVREIIWQAVENLEAIAVGSNGKPARLLLTQLGR